MMKRCLLSTALLGLAMTFASGAALSQAKFDFGKREYDVNCANCHGANGKGDGPYQPMLQKSAPDLTMLSKKNNGVFPVAHIYEVIDGRAAVKAHGPQDMPIWGADYLGKAAGYYMDVPYDPEMFVRTRINALIDYLYRLQAK
jgi:mono/diheme cytochrome c family protein